MDPLQFREAKASDIPLIYDSFLKSLKNDSSLGRSCRSKVFFKEYPHIIDHILLKSQTIVAAFDDNAIIGYCIFEPDTLHYVFVKEAFRNEKVAKTLVGLAFGERSNFSYTHRTHHIKPIVEKYIDLTFNPFLLYARGDHNGPTPQESAS